MWHQGDCPGTGATGSNCAALLPHISESQGSSWHTTLHAGGRQNSVREPNPAVQRYKLAPTARKKHQPRKVTSECACRHKVAEQGQQPHLHPGTPRCSRSRVDLH